jgi:hypothetical protein
MLAKPLSSAREEKTIEGTREKREERRASGVAVAGRVKSNRWPKTNPLSSLSPMDAKRLDFGAVSPNKAGAGRSEPPRETAKVPVFLRIKPTEVATALVPLDDTRIRAVNGRVTSEFAFSKVFPATASQQEVFDAVAGQVLDDFLVRERDGLIFAYGVTNSGKTHTVQGTPEYPGLIPQLLDRIFADPRDVFISYLQMYVVFVPLSRLTESLCLSVCVCF